MSPSLQRRTEANRFLRNYGNHLTHCTVLLPRTRNLNLHRLKTLPSDIITFRPASDIVANIFWSFIHVCNSWRRYRHVLCVSTTTFVKHLNSEYGPMKNGFSYSLKSKNEMLSSFRSRLSSLVIIIPSYLMIYNLFM
jgi:hypothetical protein